jgi:hypothetical protein
MPSWRSILVAAAAAIILALLQPNLAAPIGTFICTA